MGDTRREMDRDIDDNQSVIIIHFGFYKNNIFSVTDDKSEQTQIVNKIRAISLHDILFCQGSHNLLKSVFVK